MKAICGNLDMSKTYKLVDVDYSTGNDMSWEACENCGNAISNVAIIESDNGERYRIGLDCMETITSMSPSEKQEARNKVNRAKRFIRELKKATSITVHPFYERINDNLIPNPEIGQQFRFYFGRVRTERDVNARGLGNYRKYKSLIETLKIPVTVCDK